LSIHHLASVDPGAELGRDVEVGPFAVVGADVELGDGVWLAPHAVVLGPCVLGPGCRVFPHAVLGAEPQDLKYRGGPTRLVVGRDNVFREGATAHRGTDTRKGEHGLTIIGDGNLFMAQCHVAHDCRIGNRCVFANSVAVAGHAVIQDDAVLGGLAGIHQFARIGRRAMVAAGAMVSQDVPPFTIAKGDRARLVGLNLVGLRRAGLNGSELRALKEAFSLLFQAKLPRREALERARELARESTCVTELADFVEASRRGVCRGRR